jgi:hypothetical protein
MSDLNPKEFLNIKIAKHSLLVSGRTFFSQCIVVHSRAGEESCYQATSAPEQKLPTIKSFADELNVVVHLPRTFFGAAFAAGLLDQNCLD